MKHSLQAYILSLILLLGCISVANAQIILRGKLVQHGEGGDFPVTGLPVSILDPFTDNRSEIAYTDAEGIFTFADLFFTEYVIEIWKSGFKNTPLTYRINVTPPVVLERRAFETRILRIIAPSEREFLSGQYRLNSTATQYILSNALLARETKVKLAATFARASFKYFFDVSAIDISPEKIVPFKQEPLKKPLF